MVVAAVIGGVATVAGGAIAAGGAHDAANVASATADKNNIIAQQTRDENKGYLQPFMDRGNAAGANYNALLGLGGDPTAAKNAFDQYQGSTGYQFRVGQGLNALNTGFAAKGALNSGAAMKAIDSYGQGIASDEFGKYMGYLGNQQQNGLSGANALAGVNTNFTNQVSSNNNNAASAIGSADIAGANAINGGISNALKLIGASTGSASSYGGGGSGGSSLNGGNISVNTDKYNPFMSAGG